MARGLRNAVQTLLSTLNHLLKKLDFVRRYLDGILVPFNDYEKNQRNLEELLSLLQATKLKAN